MLLWTGLLFGVSQLALNVYLELRYPALFDGEYFTRLAYLRHQQAGNPDGPTLLVMGSSRTVMNFRPEVLAPITTDDGKRVTVFNFSHIAAGPMMNLVELQRLLRDGIRPDWLVLELMAPQMGDRRQAIAIRGARAADFPTLARHYPASRLYSSFFVNRAWPVFRYRDFLVRKMAEHLATAILPPRERVKIGPLGGDESDRLKTAVADDQRRRETEKAKSGYYPNLQKLKMCDLSLSAMREILTVCRDANIRLVLLLTPEGPEFRRWYSAEAEDAFRDYCRDIVREFNVAIVSARDWLDEGDFIDSHHVILPGAEKFTRRLAVELLEPLVRNRAVACVR